MQFNETVNWAQGQVWYTVKVQEQYNIIARVKDKAKMVLHHLKLRTIAIARYNST